MRHADYAHYRSRYQGNIIPERESHDMLAQAAYELARFERIYSIAEPEDPEAWKNALCAMADVLYMIQMAQNGTGTVSSATIGSVSVSYGNAQQMDLSPKGQDRALYRAASIHLDIYRG